MSFFNLPIHAPAGRDQIIIGIGLTLRFRRRRRFGNVIFLNVLRLVLKYFG